MSGSAARAQATSEYADTSSASQKRSRGVSVKRPSRSRASANATEWTRRSSCPSQSSPTCWKTASMLASSRTSHSVDERALHRLGEVADALLDALALVRERELRAALREPLGDGPRDRAAVRDAEDEAPLSGEVGHGGASLLASGHSQSRSSREGRAASARPSRAGSRPTAGTASSSPGAASGWRRWRRRSAARRRSATSGSGRPWTRPPPAWPSGTTRSTSSSRTRGCRAAAGSSTSRPTGSRRSPA